MFRDRHPYNNSRRTSDEPDYCRFCSKTPIYGVVCSECFIEKMTKKHIKNGAGKLNLKELLKNYQEYIDKAVFEKFTDYELREINMILHKLFHGKFSPNQAIKHHNYLVDNEFTTSEIEKIKLSKYQKNGIKCPSCLELSNHDEYKEMPIEPEDKICSKCEGFCADCGVEDDKETVDLTDVKGGKKLLLCEACRDERYQSDYPGHKKQPLTVREVTEALEFIYDIDDRISREL